MNLALTPAQHEKALAVAAELRISEADAVERALDLVLLMRWLTLGAPSPLGGRGTVL